MGYQSQNFENGKVLNASQLINMESGIKNAETIVVTIDGETASLNSIEIFNFVANGGMVVLGIANSTFVGLSFCSPEVCIFAEIQDDNVNTAHIVEENGNYSYEELLNVSVDEYIKDMGDISAALNEIIQMQDNLIGGAIA